MLNCMARRQTTSMTKHILNNFLNLPIRNFDTYSAGYITKFLLNNI